MARITGYNEIRFIEGPLEEGKTKIFCVSIFAIIPGQVGKTVSLCDAVGKKIKQCVDANASAKLCNASHWLFAANGNGLETLLAVASVEELNG
jgi:hypothetical protein